MKRPRRILLITGAVVALGLTSTGPALAADEAANCLGEDRSVQGGFPTAEEFAQALVDQLEFDRLVGYPDSTGQSLAYAATTDCSG
jgi:predicted Rdx family selenoprotein